MQLNENQLAELEARCDRALTLPTAKRQLEFMGDWFNVDISRLPPRAKLKFRRLLRSVSLNIFTVG